MVTALLLSFCLGIAAELPASPTDDPLKINDEMKQFLSSNIDPGLHSLEKLNSLVRIVFWANALNFTYVPETRTAIETYTRRGGNCISFTFLFIGMARHIGLDARFHEVDIVPIWSKVGDIVSISGHANAAVFVGGQGYVVDLFPRVDRIQLGGRIVSDERAIAHYFSNRGVGLLTEGKPLQALTSFQSALHYDPSATFALTNMGVAQSQLSRMEEAEKSYLKALEIDAGEVVAMSNLEALYQSLGREREAGRYAAKVRRFKQRNPYYHFSLGLQAYRSGEYRASVEHYRTALKLKPAEHNFHVAIAKAYFRLGQVDKASASLKLALKNAPDDNSRVLYNEKLALLAARRIRS